MYTCPVGSSPLPSAHPQGIEGITQHQVERTSAGAGFEESLAGHTALLLIHTVP